MLGVQSIKRATQISCEGTDELAGRAGIRPLVLISSLATGGAERVTVSFLSRLRAKGIEAVACTLTTRHDGPLAAELWRAGVSRYDLGARRLADPLALVRFLRLLSRGRFDVIHAHGQDASVLALAARAVSRVPLVITHHGLEEPSATWRQRARARLSLVAARQADAVIAVSAATADWLAGAARIPGDRLHVIPNGVDLERFNQADFGARRTDIRRALGFRPDQQLVLMPAALREGKGHSVLLDSLPALRARVPSARVLLVGGGELEVSLRLRARQHSNGVVFLGPRQDMPELLAACDLVVLPSWAEALPTVLIEAAAAGRPVVASRVGGATEVVEDGRTGFLVPSGNVAALVEAMTSLLTDRERARTFGETARRLAYERFTLDLQIQRTLSLWSEVVIGARHSRRVRTTG
jgi:glycosyltransferase involved in cell wall biosynthesis